MSPSLEKLITKKSYSLQWPRGSEAFEVSQVKGRASSLDRGGRHMESYLNNCRSTWVPREEVRLPLGQVVYVQQERNEEQLHMAAANTDWRP